MTLTKQQKVFIGIFGFVLVGLICDRTLLMPSEAGSEGAADLRIKRPPVSAMTVPSLPTTPAASARLRDRLDALLPDDRLDFGAVRDAFTVSDKWSGDSSHPAEGSRAIAFREKHRLKAIIHHGQEQAAFVGDAFIRIGQSLDGFRLDRLDENTATFMAENGEGGLRVVLRIDQGAGGLGSQGR